MAARGEAFYRYFLVGPLLVLLLLSGAQRAFAQDEDFFDDEDEDAEEPYYEGNTGGAPYPGHGAGNPSNPPSQRFNVPPSEGGDVPRVARPSFNNDSGLAFRLVDPPKYWKPKKRKRHPLNHSAE